MKAEQLQDKNVDHLIATIQETDTTSDVIKLFGTTIVAFQTPVALTGITFKFLGSIDKGETFKMVRDEFGNDVSVSVLPDGSYPMDPKIFAPYDEIQIVSNANEAATRVILIKPFAI